MASQASMHFGARVLAQGCWLPTSAPNFMEKMTQLLVVKGTQLQDNIWAVRIHPALLETPVPGAVGPTGSCPSAQGCCSFLGRDFPAGSSLTTLEQGQPLGRCSCWLAPGSDSAQVTPAFPTHLPAAAHQLVKDFFSPAMLF